MNSESPVTTVRDPYWAERLESARTDDELMSHAWSYLRASLAAGWPTTAVARNARRREVAAFLIEAAQHR